MVARSTMVLAVLLLSIPVVVFASCSEGSTPAAPTPTPTPEETFTESIDSLRAADAGLIDALAALNDGFIEAAASSDAFANESDALDDYAATLQSALLTYRDGLQAALTAYATFIAQLAETPANDQFDAFVTTLPAWVALHVVRQLAYETYDAAREAGFQTIKEAAFSATGEVERRAALHALAEGSPTLLAAMTDFDAAGEAKDSAIDSLISAISEFPPKGGSSRHGVNYERALLSALDSIDEPARDAKAKEAARASYARSPNAAFDAAFNSMRNGYASVFASVPLPTPAPIPTATPSPTPKPPLGFSRAYVQSEFEAAGFGNLNFFGDDLYALTFYDGTGSGIDLELWGPAHDLEGVGLTFLVYDYDPPNVFSETHDLAIEQACTLLMLIIVPEWEGGVNWVLDRVSALGRSGDVDFQYAYGDKSIKLTYRSEFRLGYLSIEGA